MSWYLVYAKFPSIANSAIIFVFYMKNRFSYNNSNYKKMVIISRNSKYFEKYIKACCEDCELNFRIPGFGATLLFREFKTAPILFLNAYTSMSQIKKKLFVAWCLSLDRTWGKRLSLRILDVFHGNGCDQLNPRCVRNIKQLPNSMEFNKIWSWNICSLGSVSPWYS